MRTRAYVIACLLLLTTACGGESDRGSPSEEGAIDLIRATQIAMAAVDAEVKRSGAYLPLEAKRHHIDGREIWWFDFKPAEFAVDLSPTVLRMAGGNLYVTVDIATGEVEIRRHS